MDPGQSGKRRGAADSNSVAAPGRGDSGDHQAMGPIDILHAPVSRDFDPKIPIQILPPGGFLMLGMILLVFASIREARDRRARRGAVEGA